MSQTPLLRQGPLKNLYEDELHVHWHPTDRCNFKCSYCFGGSSRQASREKFSTWAQLRQAADSLIALGRKKNFFIFAGGGEPTLHPHLPELLAYLHEKLGGRISLKIISNGSQPLAYYQKLVELCPTAKIHFHFSVHTEKAKKEHLKALAETLTPIAFVHFSLMFYPEKRAYVKDLGEMFCQLKPHMPFTMQTELLFGPPGFVKIDDRYTADDFKWHQEIAKRFMAIKSPAALSSSPLRSSPVFWEVLEGEQRKIMEGLGQHSILTGTSEFKNMWCGLGSHVVAINSDGRFMGARCGAAGKLASNIFYQASPFAQKTLPALVKCPYDTCECNTNWQIPKFKEADEAAEFMQEYIAKYFPGGPREIFPLANTNIWQKSILSLYGLAVRPFAKAATRYRLKVDPGEFFAKARKPANVAVRKLLKLLGPWPF